MDILSVIKSRVFISSSLDMAITWSSGPSPDWTLLPKDVFGLVLDKLVDISDRVRTASVCKPWLSIAQDHSMRWLKPAPTQLPMLLVPTDDNSTTHRGLYCVDGNRVLGSRLHIPYSKRCCGSSHGWLIFAEEDLALTLFNPFSQETIHLPPITRVPTSEEIGESYYSHEYEIRKAVLSKDPSLAPNDYEVLALYGFCDARLALFQSGENSWVYLKQENYEEYYFEDIIYYQGHRLALGSKCCVYKVLVSVVSDGEGIIRLGCIKRLKSRAEQSYIVDCGDSLMWIDRFYVQSDYIGDDDDDDLGSSEDDADDHQDSTDEDDHDQDSSNDRATGYFEIDGKLYTYISDIHHLTSSFKVCQMKSIEGNIELVESDQLDGRALFLGHNHSCWILASDFPGCRPNCIYYMDDWMEAAYQPLGAIDIGVFSLEDQCTRPLYVPTPKQWELPPPIWIVPQGNPVNMLSLSE
ncbi:hypothetical protein CDL15_Pgr027494 [Punica granatum]|uniref:KIB1-4 beta-propeller domain-containing protein n=1 Tax=Punica granatum TaxID=22663 RepID=A0A218XIE3_PUNGR|nr:hypothetical protein CDL15_Pgr027494 [Punica granatum]